MFLALALCWLMLLPLVIRRTHYKHFLLWLGINKQIKFKLTSKVKLDATQLEYILKHQQGGQRNNKLSKSIQSFFSLGLNFTGFLR